MTNPEVIINSVDGWLPTTRLYRIGARYWLIQVQDVAAVTRIMQRARQQFTALGVDPPTDTGADMVAAPTVIFEADVEITPVMEDVIDIPADPPPEGSTLEAIESEDGSAVFILDGEPWGTRTRRQVDQAYRITPIDADGDPLTGLTPWARLDPGTTFEQALDHIQRNTRNTE